MKSEVPVLRGIRTASLNPISRSRSLGPESEKLVGN